MKQKENDNDDNVCKIYDGLYIALVLIQKITKISRKFAYKKLLLRCIHHFDSDVINNTDHMRMSGNEPSSVILSQTKWI